MFYILTEGIVAYIVNIYIKEPTFYLKLYIFVKNYNNAVGKKIAIFPLVILIKFYQKAISPWMGNNCRFTPTCSNYMLEALKTRGLFYGFWLGAKRICRCHPWGGSGYDPVPHKKNTIEK